ncbi:MAG: phosphate ABC transporter substrate-binding protein PstS [Chloroflexota bacterium]|nr:phosphate ABC transporter substrate-binding protein PstS [Chloroflexota bacterium]
MYKTHTHLGFAAAVLAAVLAVAGCGGSGRTQTSSVAGVQTSQSRSSSALVGAGSTLVAPLVGAWQSDYSKSHGVQISYGAIGSGGGIAQISARTVDFGASDAPLTADQKAGCQGCVMVPWALAATTVAVNVPGVTGHLKLTGPVVADIYLGKITTWNDPAIRKLNPGLKLPAQRIAPVYRSDGSGDTYAFTDYLSHVSPAFKAKMGGASTQVSWPVGTGAKGNAGVAATVEQTPGAIAYVAIAQAEGSHLNVALIRNRAGRYPVPAPATIAAAAVGARFRPDNSVSIVDSSGADAYPIATFTSAIVSRSSSKLAELKRFLDYAVTTGQKVAPQLAFAPLPKAVVAKDEAIVKAL